MGHLDTDTMLNTEINEHRFNEKSYPELLQ